ncbi:MAG TPA: extracellular solute-binding protein [Thermoflexia bacterium]|jgi:tungstate transport system substrate-binding protein|nr:extracellular solute-binding protein [Thermoflexia bacterium]
MTRRGTLLLAIGLVMLAGCGEATPTAPPRLILATTTSTYDSGLLDYLLPAFEEETGIQVEVVAVGTGQALELGRNGDADVLLVHAPDQEEAFVGMGYGVDREPVMYNDFVIVGPEEDPAGVAGLTNAAVAFAQIAAAEAPFVSRGDNSGTHMKERRIWLEAGIGPEGDWYISAGQGMGAVLTMAEELGAYTLTDRGTYLSRLAEGYSLPILVEGDPLLFNPYHVMAVNPEVHPNVNYEGAKRFIEWLTSLETQERIGAFTHAATGQPLFHPDSEAWRAAHP